MSRVAGTVAATEIVAPSVQAGAMALPALPDMPAMPGAAPVAATAAPVGITPEQGAEAIAIFTAFDAQYDLLVTAHTAQIVATYAAMYASIAAQQGASHVAQLAAFTAYSATFVMNVTTMAAAVVAQFTSMTSQNTALLTTGTATWLTLLITFITNSMAQWVTYINNLLSTTNLGLTGITGLWQTFAANLGSILNDSIRPVFDSFLPMLQTLEGWFRSTVDNIGTIWGEIEPKTKNPARVVINDVYNTGLRTAWNSFNEFLGLKALPEYTAKFATGGPVDFRDGGSVFGPGHSTSDSIPARLSRGEHVITAREVRSAGGHGVIQAQREAWKRHGPVDRTADRAHYALAKGGPVLQRFATGGPVEEMPPMKGSEGGLNVNAIRAGRAISLKFPQVQTIGGYRPSDPFPDHPSGNALDIMVGSLSLGDAIHDWLWNNNSKLFMASDIWKQTYWTSRTNGSLMEDRGSITENHFDHVHALFTPSPKGSGGISYGGIPIGTPAIFADAGGSVSYEQLIGDAFSQAFDAMKNLPKFEGGIGQWIPKSIEKARTAEKFMVEKSNEVMAKMVDPSGPAVDRWRPLAMEALRRHGYNADQHIAAMLKQIEYESSGDPDSINLWDSNAKAGYPSGGLLHVIEPTYRRVRNQYPEAFMGLPDNRMHPLTNLTAGVGAVRADWGGPAGRWPTRGGYDQGGFLPPTPDGFSTFYNHTSKPEPVLTNPQWDAVYRAAMATTEAQEVARGFRSAVTSMEYGSATEKAAQQIARTFGPSVEDITVGYYDASKLVADTVVEQTTTWRTQFDGFMAGVKSFTDTVSDLYATGKEIHAKLEEDGVIKKIEEATQSEVKVLQDIANRVSQGAAVNEAMLHEVGNNLSVIGAKAFEILAQQPFETYAPIFDKLATLADMLPKAERSYVPWAGLETTMTPAKSLELGMNTIGNGIKGLYNVAQSVAGPILRNVSGIGGVISRFASENTGAVTAIMAAVTTGNPLLALPFLPQIIDALFELIPMVIQAIMDIVPNLIESIMDLFDFMNPSNVPSYGTLDEAVKAANEAAADVRSGKYQYERGADSTWRPTDDGTTQMNFYGDLSFPNVKSDADAEGFINHLSRM